MPRRKEEGTDASSPGAPPPSQLRNEPRGSNAQLPLLAARNNASVRSQTAVGFRCSGRRHVPYITRVLRKRREEGGEGEGRAKDRNGTAVWRRRWWCLSPSLLLLASVSLSFSPRSPPRPFPSSLILLLSSVVFFLLFRWPALTTTFTQAASSVGSWHEIRGILWWNKSVAKRHKAASRTRMTSPSNFLCQYPAPTRGMAGIFLLVSSRSARFWFLLFLCVRRRVSFRPRGRRKMCFFKVPKLQTHGLDPR